MSESNGSPQAAERTAARVLRLPQVCKAVGLGRSMVYRMEAERRFPRRVKIGARAVGWIESEVQAWIQQRIEGARSGALPLGQRSDDHV